MDSATDQLKNYARTYFRSVTIRDEEDLRREFTKIAETVVIFTGIAVESEEFEQVYRELRYEENISIEPGVALTSHSSWTEWLQDYRDSSADVSDMRWKAYAEYLRFDCNRSNNVVFRLGKTADEILGLLSDPRKEKTSISRKGLILGDVQSGKTQTYLALMNKAVDCGYKLIVVLTSSNEDLRQQTQSRVDTDFIGRANDPMLFKTTKLGISNYFKNPDSIQSLTSTEFDFIDFRKRAFNGIERPNWDSSPFVAVIKKNSQVLKSFNEWLNQRFDKDIPVLLIDDECDYASVNTSKEDDDPTAINKHLRTLFRISNRTSYVAVTATPFANIFIDDEEENDLFPSDFIYSTNSPSNYLGAKQIFGDLDNSHFNEQNVRLIDEIEAQEWLPVKHKKTAFIGSKLDEQLQYAVDTFIIASAMHDTAGSMTRSMLIHVSRFTDVQSQVATQVDAHLSELCDAIELHFADDSDPAIHELHEVFEKEYSNQTDRTWEQMKLDISEVLRHTGVHIANAAKDTESWNSSHYPDLFSDDRAAVIQVGGDKLSRGMTLDGLIVSFFYRNTGAADTLLQMGRWFGYRDGYQELTRIWVLPQTVHDLQYAATVLADLKNSIRSMKKLRATPKDFGIEIQKNPAKGVRITNLSKMRRAVEHESRSSLEADLAGRRVESTILPFDEEQSRQNFTAATYLISEATKSKASTCYLGQRNESAICYETISAEFVQNFLHNYRAGYKDEFFGPIIFSSGTQEAEYGYSLAELYAKTHYSETESSMQDFPTWDLVVKLTGEGEQMRDSLLPFDVQLTSRKCDIASMERKTFGISGGSRRLGSVGDVKNYVLKRGIQSKTDMTFKDEKRYYPYLRKPTLFIYFLKPKPSDERSRAFENISVAVGAKILVPGEPEKDSQSGLVYYYNTVAEKQSFRQALRELGNE